MEARIEHLGGRLPLPKVRPQTILMLVVLGLALHILLPQVGELRHSVKAIERANWSWMAVALVTTAATFAAAAVALTAASGRPLPFAETVEAQLASSFVNRLAPGSVGGLGLNERFLAHHGLDNTEAGAALALNGLAGVMVHVSALIVAGFAASGDSSVHLPHPRHWELAAGFALFLAILGIVWRIPRLKSHILPAVTEAWHSLTRVLGHPRQAALLFAGAAGITGAYTVTFILCLAAFHAHISIAQATAVYLGGAVVSAAAPTPGGLGAMEAALVAGLTHVGVADGKAVTAVLGFRLLTYWLPILPGYLSLRRLRRAGLL
jgi:glycosyltransferase 2 family protein